jgi:hypothetical protein
MTAAGFEPAIPVSKRSQSLAVDPLGHWDRRFFLYYTKSC